MAGEQAETLPDPLRQWLDTKAAELDVDRSEVVARAVAAARLVEENEDVLAGLVPEAERVADLDDRVSTLEARVGDVEDDVEAKITDVRERVVQVKREADAKAPSDHDHPEYGARLDRTAAEVADLDAAVSDLDERVEGGFENYEDVLGYLVDAADELDGKVGSLARALVDLRERVSALESAQAERAAVTDLQQTANRHGERTAACADCGTTVAVGLLARPACPHCEATFTDFVPSRGFFGSAALETGSRPALEAADSVDAPADLFDDASDHD